MAYMSQERKAALAPAIKAVCKKYGIKASLRVRHHSALVLTITEGPIDFFEVYNRITQQEYDRYNQSHAYVAQSGDMDVNPYHYEKHFEGVALEFLKELFSAMNVGNHDKSDIQSDYFDVGWYVDVDIGKYSKPYKLTKEAIK